MRGSVLISLIFTFLVRAAGPAPAMADLDPDLEIIEAAIRGNEEARRRIKSCSYEVEYEFEYPVPHVLLPARAHGTIVVQQEGVKRATRNSRTSKFDSRPEQTERCHSVLTERWFASWLQGTGIAHQWDHESPDSMTHVASVTMATDMAPDILRHYVFGMEPSLTLRELYELEAPRHRWKVIERKEADGTRVIELHRYRPSQAPNSRVSAITLSPDRDFLITRRQVWDASGAVARDCSVQLQSIVGADGNIYWFPLSVVEERYENGKLAEKGVLRIRDVRINNQIPQQVFELAALELEEGTMLFRETVSGSKPSYVWRGGEPIAIDLPVATPDDEIIPAPPEAYSVALPSENSDSSTTVTGPQLAVNWRKVRTAMSALGGVVLLLGLIICLNLWRQERGARR